MKKTENEWVIFTIENNILHCIYKKDQLIDLQAAEKVIQARLELTGGNSYACITDMANINNISKEAREFFALKENTRGILKVGFYGASMFNKLLSVIFLSINKPPIQCRFFTSKDEALRWAMN